MKLILAVFFYKCTSKVFLVWDASLCDRPFRFHSLKCLNVMVLFCKCGFPEQQTIQTETPNIHMMCSVLWEQHSPEAAAAPGGWAPEDVDVPPGVGGTGLDQDFAAAGPTLTTPTYSTNVPGKSPFSFVLSLVPCSQPLGLRSSPSWYSRPGAAIMEALETVSRSPGWRLMSSPRSRLYSKSARYWKLSEAMPITVHKLLLKPKVQMMPEIFCVKVRSAPWKIPNGNSVSEKSLRWNWNWTQTWETWMAAWDLLRRADLDLIKIWSLRWNLTPVFSPTTPWRAS